MRTITHVAASLALLAAFATGASAQPNGSDAVKYEPKTHNLAGTVPFERQYTLDITSPAKLNDKGDKVLAAGITADLRVNVLYFPEGSNAAAASALVTLADPFLTFDELAQTQPTTVWFRATMNTIPGNYVFEIQTDGPTGIGWGNGSHTLTVTVSALGPSDTTSPAVVITSPEQGKAFTFCSAGTIVPVTISAIDGESFVTSVWAEANRTSFPVSVAGGPSNNVIATGKFTATGIGTYALQGWAESAGGIGESVVVNVSANYAMAWLPPLSLGGIVSGALPIKFTARDCNGAFVADNRVRVEVLEGGISRFAATFGDGSNAVRIDEMQGQYVINFKPASGAHTYTVKVFFGGFEQASKDFTTR